MNNFEAISDIIRRRRAIFPNQYIDQDIPIDVIDQLLELGNWAPTHRRTEPWRFIVISGDARQRLGDFLTEAYKVTTPADKFSPLKAGKITGKCLKSQYIILICMQRDPLERVPEWEEIASVSMAVQNMWLGCAALGIGCYWSTPATKDAIGDFVSLESGEQCLGFFYIGSFEGDWPPGSRTSVADRVRYMTA